MIDFSENKIERPIEYTVAIIKPDAIDLGLADKIKEMIKKEGLEIYLEKDSHLDDTEVYELYKKHAGEDYWKDLKSFLISGQSTILILKGEDAVQKWRKIVEQEIRPSFSGENPNFNCVHGSDNSEAARFEAVKLGINLP